MLTILQISGFFEIFAYTLTEQNPKIEIPSSITISKINFDDNGLIKSIGSTGRKDIKLKVTPLASNLETTNWIQKIMNEYGQLIFPIYTEFVSTSGKNTNGVKARVTLNIPEGVNKPSIYAVDTSGNIEKINSTINKKNNTISFLVTKDNRYFALIDSKVQTKKEQKKSKTKNILKKANKSKQKRTSDQTVKIEQLLTFPWNLMSLLIISKLRKKDLKNIAKRYKNKHGKRYIKHRYLKQYGKRYK